MNRSKLMINERNTDKDWEKIGLENPYWGVISAPEFNYLKEENVDLLEEKGRLVVAVPNYESYDALFYKSFWAGYDTPRHLWHLNQKITEQIKQFGIILQHHQPEQ